MMFQASDATVLTGLTPHQLREWCGRSRRGILPADVLPGGPGRNALYSWQTLLTLRLLLSLQKGFGVELTKYAQAAVELRAQLQGISFPSLWPVSAVFQTHLTVDLSTNPAELLKQGGLALPLAPHLTVLATALSLPIDKQLSLLPPMAVQK